MFCPRSGSSAEPGRPTLPVISARLQISCTTSEPYLCSVTPRPQRTQALVGLAVDVRGALDVGGGDAADLLDGRPACSAASSSAQRVVALGAARR